ncbi:MAG TPA: hypothetical protein VLT58_00930 [Polyangia bacterium]|nr:hypothetical protein [Polyangia bacterium]
MSRIQNILEKAEREGTALRTSQMAVPTATVPITIELPNRPVEEPVMIVPGSASAGHAPAGATAVGAPIAVANPAPSSATSSDALEHVSVRLNPLLVAGLAPKLLEREPAAPTRLTGVSAQNLVPAAAPQLGLFVPAARPADKLNRALDAIASKFGNAAITTGDIAAGPGDDPTRRAPPPSELGRRDPAKRRTSER